MRIETFSSTRAQALSVYYSIDLLDAYDIQEIVPGAIYRNTATIDYIPTYLVGDFRKQVHYALRTGIAYSVAVTDMEIDITDQYVDTVAMGL